MHLTGIGGGGFMLIRAANGTYEFIDFRESAPAASYETMYNSNVNASIFGGLARCEISKSIFYSGLSFSFSGIPGEIRGLEYLHNKYGSLPWAELIQPAIKLARHGFKLGSDVAYYIDALGNDELFLSPAWAPDFAPNGARIKVGDIMTRKRLADTLKVIADKGADAFYSGSIAQATISALRADNGIMTLEDLMNYKVICRKPRSINYQNLRIVSGGAPSGGIVALKILKTLDGYGDTGDPAKLNITTHRLDEAMRFAYGAVGFK
jgi:gamma-glutamyltranspeptidase/glutathione hydrolase